MRGSSLIEFECDVQDAGLYAAECILGSSLVEPSLPSLSLAPMSAAAAAAAPPSFEG
jgi:hypothetical protein